MHTNWRWIKQRKNNVTLAGLFESRRCCNTGLLKYHKDIEDKSPEIIDKFTNIEDTQYETFNIRGIQKGVQSTHIIKCWMTFEAKGVTPPETIGLSKEMTVDTLFGLQLMIGAIFLPEL